MPDQPLLDPAWRAQEHQELVEVDSDRGRNALDGTAIGSRQGVAERSARSTAATPPDLEVRKRVVKGADDVARVDVLADPDGGSDVLGVVDDLSGEQPAVELQGDECPTRPTRLG